MSEVTFGQGQLEELAKFTDPQNEIIANLAKALLSTTKRRNEFAQQLSELQLSQQNIINSFGIKGEGAHSKLVIEYMHGLVAENAALKHAILETQGGIELASAAINDDKRGDTFRDILNAIYMKTSAETPATDAAIAEIKASELDDLAISIMGYAPVIESDEYHVYEVIAKDVTDRAANLRAGRKG